MKIKKKLLIILIMLTIMAVGCSNGNSKKQEQKNISQEQEQQLLLNGISLTKDIIRSVYRGEENYTYEVLLFILAINDDENNLYKGYFPFEEDKGFIFPLDKSNEVLIQVFGEKEYTSLEDLFDYDEESNIYYKNLDFGWNTGYIAENVRAYISDDKSKLYTQFELINQWYDVGGDPVPTAIAECEITYSIINSNDKIYLQFENMNTEKKDINVGIDRTEYLTGEIITDGIYPSNYQGVIYFVPDEESSKIIKEKYNAAEESFQLIYNDMSKVENLPKELGIFKVRVKIDWNEKGRSFVLNDIQLTDKIGTIKHEGKTYETNVLDENVKVKDKVCGLIVKWISREKDTDGIQIRFAGEIESEGYYSITYSEMYDDNFGRIHFDEEYFDNIPMYVEKGFNNFYFAKSNDLFEQLVGFSSFGRGRFKTSNFQLVYNIGMGRPASDHVTEIVSLDENYKNMFEFDKYQYVGPIGVDKDFVIVSSANYDENLNYLSNDFYYINKSKPEKIFLFNSLGYNYELKLTASENEFILSTNGFNTYNGEQNEGHSIICKITENEVITEKTEGLSIDSDKIDDTGKNFNIQGNIENIKIQDNKVFMSIKDIKMKDEDALAFGMTLNRNDLLDILIIDSNSSGPFINVGDKIMVSCRYTKDKEILYTFGADIRSYEY